MEEKERQNAPPSSSCYSHSQPQNKQQKLKSPKYCKNEEENINSLRKEKSKNLCFYLEKVQTTGKGIHSIKQVKKNFFLKSFFKKINFCFIPSYQIILF